MELVKQFEDHKSFLFEIFKKNDADWANKQEVKKQERIWDIK